MPNFISRNYTTQNFPNGPQTIEDRILLFADRVRGWQIDPALRCIQHDPHAGFAVLHIVVSYFEVIGMIEFDANTHAYLMTQDGDWEGGKEFKAGLMSVLPELANHKSNQVRWFRNDFYIKVRCGLYHQSMTRSGIFISSQLAQANGYEFRDLGNQGCAIAINPHRLAERLSGHLTAFELRLRDPLNQKLRQRFDDVFQKLQ